MIQKAGTDREHFDICKSKRVLAVRHGAIAIGTRELAAKLNERRGASARREEPHEE